jgi:hypothetical protein
MPFDKFEDSDAISAGRRKAIAKSLRTISVEELKKLGEQLFTSPDHPWRDKFFELIEQDSGTGFHHADVGDGVIFLYDRGADKGLWCLPGSGMGPLSERGRTLMKEAIAQGH